MTIDSSKLTKKIIVAMMIGAVFGIGLNFLPKDSFMHVYFVHGILEVIGAVFIKSLKMLVVPMVFVSLVCGVCNLKDIKSLGRIGGRTLGFYLSTTAIAIAVAMTVAYLVDPGAGITIGSETTFQAKEAPPLVQVLIDIFPSNPVSAAAKGKMLQVIVFAVLFGLALATLNDQTKDVVKFFHQTEKVIMRIITFLMLIAPYGVFALITKVFSSQGMSAILPMAKYFFCVVGVLLFHAFVVYGTALKIFARLDPKIFFQKLKPVLTFAFSTASSNATLPITMQTVEEDIGCDNSIASFTLPLGATINMDGTAIMQGVATVFLATATGIDLGFSDFLMVILTATLASIGTAGVPGVGLITLSMVLQQVGIPVEGIGLIIGVDRLLDMVRTGVNVTGDATVTCIVARKEGQFDEEIYNRVEA